MKIINEQQFSIINNQLKGGSNEFLGKNPRGLKKEHSGRP
jgi:hypothetical protein